MCVDATWGDDHTRWIGPSLIRSFREHHRDPRAMLGHDWIEVNREPAIAASVVVTSTVDVTALADAPVATTAGAT